MGDEGLGLPVCEDMEAYKANMARRLASCQEQLASWQASLSRQTAATRIQVFWRRYRSWKLRQEQPKEGHPPTEWEADTVEGAEGANNQCLMQ